MKANTQALNPGFDEHALVSALRKLRDGDFSVRLPEGVGARGEISSLFNEVVTDLNFDVVTAADGLSALSILEASDCRIDVVLTDFAMPGITGAETVLRARELHPDIPAVLMTGYADDRISVRALRETTVLRKPIEASDLRAALDEVSASRRPGVAVERLGPN